MQAVLLYNKAILNAKTVSFPSEERAIDFCNRVNRLNSNLKAEFTPLYELN